MTKFSSILPITKWFDEQVYFPLIIAGPCSVESYEQIIKTAEAISEIPQVSIFRAGVWKPRTSPNDFSGKGEEALDWLKEIQSRYKLNVAVEVLSAKHVELCLNKKINIIWLGTRTVSNPYSVQEIADALKGTETIVLIKNPINPDIRLWLGAIERIYKSGIRKIAAVHRGFYPFEPTQFRNIPKWELIIELKTRFPKLPIFCDPSHIAGDAKFIFEISQKALDLCYDGLMIETHINPKEALSDKQQQITPNNLKKILLNLTICSNKDNKEHLELIKLREQVDSIDMQLLELLSYRMKIIKQMAKYKKHNNLSVLQLKRWKEILESRLNKAKQLGMNQQFIKSLLDVIHIEAIRIQSERLNKKK
jgi:chorismate mutase